MEFDADQENTFGRSGPRIHGAIFMANRKTKSECLKRKLFGLPPPQINFVKKVKSGMILFLFEYEERKLYGVFQASSDGACNIVPNAFKSSGKQFPAQIRFKSVWHCKPLSERDFGDAIRENYYTSNKFNQGLSESQVSELLRLFSSRRIGTQKSKSPLLKEKLFNRSLSSVSGRVFEDDESRESASGQSQVRQAIDMPLDTPYSDFSRSYLNPSSKPGRSIDSDSLKFGSQQGLSSSGHVNNAYTNSSGVGIDAKVSQQGFFGYPSGLADSLPSPRNQGTFLRSGSSDEKNKLGEYIPLEDDSSTNPSSCPGKDPPYVAEFVTPIRVGLRSDIPDRISVFERLKGRSNIFQADVRDDYMSEDIDNEYEDVLKDYISADVDREIEDLLLTTKEAECNNVVVGEPLVNFKRRNKNRPIQNVMTTKESDKSSGNLTCKRRKISRPSFVREGAHKKGISADGLDASSCHEITECKEKETSEKSVTTNGGEQSENFGMQIMVHPAYGEGKVKEPSENVVVQNVDLTVCSENNIDKTKFDSAKGRGEAFEKEPTVGLVPEISENEDGSSNADTEMLSNSRNLKERVEELLRELKDIQGFACEQNAAQNTQ